MVKEFKNSLHLRLDKETKARIKAGLWSKDFGCLEFLRTETRSCDFDDVDDVVIINERFVLTADDLDDLANGKTVIVSECENIDDYKDWWR